MTTETSQRSRDGERGKPLLVLASTKGYENRLFAEAAARLDIPLAWGTDRCHRLEDPWQDGALALRYQDPEGSAKKIIEIAAARPFQGIVALGDRAPRTAARACATLGLPYNAPEATEACRNKFLARQRMQAAGLPVPLFRRLHLDDDVRQAAEQVPYPCVLKPLALSASQGVIRADTPGEFVLAFERIAALLRDPAIRVQREETSEWILAEGYLPGREVSVEALLDRGRVNPLAIFDKPEPLEGPFFEETLFVTPSREPPAVQAEILETVRRGAEALGLYHGPIHAELRVTPEGPRLLEVAPRAIGGLCARAVRFRTGRSLPELILAHAYGMPVQPLTREEAAAGVMMIPIPRAGIFEGVEGLEKARGVAGIEDIVITAKEDYPILPLPEGSSYLGFIFARGRVPEEVEQSLREAHTCLRFRIADRLPVPHPIGQGSRA